MQVTVQFFAAFREAAGQRERSLETFAKTTGELRAELVKTIPALAGTASVAVNERLANWKTAIAEGDRILLFPPVAGG